MTGMTLDELDACIQRNPTDGLLLRMGNGLVVLYFVREQWGTRGAHYICLEGRGARWPLELMWYRSDVDAFFDEMGGVVDVLEIV